MAAQFMAKSLPCRMRPRPRHIIASSGRLEWRTGTHAIPAGRYAGARRALMGADRCRSRASDELSSGRLDRVSAAGFIHIMKQRACPIPHTEARRRDRRDARAASGARWKFACFGSIKPRMTRAAAGEGCRGTRRGRAFSYRMYVHLGQFSVLDVVPAKGLEICGHKHKKTNERMHSPATMAMRQ
jgi:hypothetical protein